MKLYHFTSIEAAKEILSGCGIQRGDVPFTPTQYGYNAPWLTVEDGASSQGWATGTPLDKTAVRLTVNVPDDDKRLVKWTDLAVFIGVEDWWFTALDEAGGHGSGDWYLYLGIVPRSYITYVRGELNAKAPTNG